MTALKSKNQTNTNISATLMWLSI